MILEMVVRLCIINNKFNKHVFISVIYIYNIIIMKYSNVSYEKLTAVHMLTIELFNLFKCILKMSDEPSPIYSNNNTKDLRINLNN